VNGTTVLEETHVAGEWLCGVGRSFEACAASSNLQLRGRTGRLKGGDELGWRRRPFETVEPMKGHVSHLPSPPAIIRLGRPFGRGEWLRGGEVSGTRVVAGLLLGLFVPSHMLLSGTPK
jgi:hypothetical protein